MTLLKENNDFVIYYKMLENIYCKVIFDVLNHIQL